MGTGENLQGREHALMPSTTNGVLEAVGGTLGETTDWIYNTSIRPNRMMAFGVSLAVLGTVMGHRVMGPTVPVPSTLGEESRRCTSVRLRA
jgi:hypothetical protein